MQHNDVLYYCIFVTVIYHYFISLFIIIIAITGYNVITTVITTIKCGIIFLYCCATCASCVMKYLHIGHRSLFY